MARLGKVSVTRFFTILSSRFRTLISVLTYCSTFFNRRGAEDAEKEKAGAILVKMEVTALNKF